MSRVFTMVSEVEPDKLLREGRKTMDRIISPAYMTPKARRGRTLGEGGANSVEPLTIRPSQAAKLCGLSSRTICRMAESGELPATKVRGAWLINRDAFFRIIGARA